jgi:hypothetical protein
VPVWSSNGAEARSGRSAVRLATSDMRPTRPYSGRLAFPKSGRRYSARPPSGLRFGLGRSYRMVQSAASDRKRKSGMVVTLHRALFRSDINPAVLSAGMIFCCDEGCLRPHGVRAGADFRLHAGDYKCTSCSQVCSFIVS